MMDMECILSKIKLIKHSTFIQNLNHRSVTMFTPISTNLILKLNGFSVQLYHMIGLSFQMNYRILIKLSINKPSFFKVWKMCQSLLINIKYLLRLKNQKK